MVLIEEINAWVHCLPVTKLQFEAFLCHTPDSKFDDEWYASVLDRNPRVSPGAVSEFNYWQAFLTAIRPEEAQAYARWCGDGFTLLTADDWRRLYRTLMARPPRTTAWSDDVPLTSQRCRVLIERVAAAQQAVAARELADRRTLADSFLMRLGVMEWVTVQGRSGETLFGGLGRPPRSLHPTLFSPEFGGIEQPAPGSTDRFRAYGFRLVRKV